MVIQPQIYSSADVFRQSRVVGQSGYVRSKLSDVVGDFVDLHLYHHLIVGWQLDIVVGLRQSGVVTGSSSIDFPSRLPVQHRLPITYPETTAMAVNNKFHRYSKNEVLYSAQSVRS